MDIRVDHFEDDRTPHKLVFPDLHAALQAQHIPHITAWQTVSHDGLPAMRVRLEQAPPDGALLHVPDDLISFEVQPNHNHPALNALLVLSWHQKLESMGVGPNSPRA